MTFEHRRLVRRPKPGKRPVDSSLLRGMTNAYSWEAGLWQPVSFIYRQLRHRPAGSVVLLSTWLWVCAVMYAKAYYERLGVDFGEIEISKTIIMSNAAPYLLVLGFMAITLLALIAEVLWGAWMLTRKWLRLFLRKLVGSSMEVDGKIAGHAISVLFVSSVGALIMCSFLFMVKGTRDADARLHSGHAGGSAILQNAFGVTAQTIWERWIGEGPTPFQDTGGKAASGAAVLLLAERNGVSIFYDLDSCEVMHVPSASVVGRYSLAKSASKVTPTNRCD